MLKNSLRRHASESRHPEKTDYSRIPAPAYDLPGQASRAGMTKRLAPVFSLKFLRRRQLLLALGAGAFAPLASFAQQRKVWRIGFLWIIEPSDFIPRRDAFRAGISALGYTEGRDYVIELRAAQSNLARLPALAAELVALKVDVIVSSGTPSVVAAIKATRARYRFYSRLLAIR